MPQIDRFIDFMVKQQAEKFIVPSGRPCIIERGGTAMPVQQQLTEPQIQSIVNEIAPPGTLGRVPYECGMGRFEVLVEGNDGNLQLTIAPWNEAAAAAVPLPPPPPGAPATAATGQLGGTKRIKHMDEMFRLIKEMSGSDIHLSSNEQPVFRIHGTMKRLPEYEVSSADHLETILKMIMPERNKREYDETHDTDFAYEIPGVARYRCNIFADRYGIGAVFRLIPSEVLSAEQLGIAGEKWMDLCWLSKGLVVVTGPTGSGKSTTLAGMMDYVNKNRDDHVITIEDPIEFVHRNIKCLINQRQVHEHTDSFSKALRAALREDPDIILVGEMRDLETIELAIHAAETGHLVFGTLHTTTAPSTVDRIIDQFPPTQQEQIRVMLSEALKGVIAQVLVKTVDGKRAAAHEVLLIDPASANLIREGKTFQLISQMQIGKSRGCITMNDALLKLVQEGRVEAKEAYVKAVDKIGMKQLFEAKNIKLDMEGMGQG